MDVASIFTARTLLNRENVTASITEVLVSKTFPVATAS